MPCIGGLISGTTGPYRKIAHTISQSVEPRHFELLLKSSGFQKTTSLRLFPGVAIIYTGKKTTVY
jgi:ubiquinone/menaquinone biosynthesis C-methylase UbiE